jgi:hypothetical protein
MKKFLIIATMFYLSSCATNKIQKIGNEDIFEFVGDLRWDDCSKVYVLHTRINSTGDTIFQKRINKNCKGMKTFADKNQQNIFTVPID